MESLPEVSRSCYPTQYEVDRDTGVGTGNPPSYQHRDEGSDGAFLDEIRSLLEDDPFTDLDLLAFDGLYASDSLDSYREF